MKTYLDYYKLLGVKTTATSKEIKRAYHQLALQFHPDRHYDQKTEERGKGIFQDISEAYFVLSDSKTRNEYDRMTHRKFPGIVRGASSGSESVFNGIKKNGRKKKKWTRYPALNYLFDFIELMAMLVVLIFPFAAPFILIFLFLMFFRF